MTPKPFQFVPNSADIADLQNRLARKRLSPAATDTAGHLGIPPAALSRLAQEFSSLDWESFSARINRLPNFTVQHNGQTLHFVHARNVRADAIPVLLLHGWPGSFLEFEEVIPALVAGSPAFHAVCPSLPGYGFSERSLEQPYRAEATADTMVSLMHGLGYDRFLVQGGDWGATIATEIARRHPDTCLGLHLNLVAIPAPEDTKLREALRPGERAWLDEAAGFYAEGMGYYSIQSTRPQTLACGLSDSPYGLLAWIGEKFLAWSDRDAKGQSLVSDRKIVENVALYWITNSIGSSIRLYYDGAHGRTEQTPVTVPTGVAIFPREIMKTPRAWTESRFNVVRWTEYDRGGHFAALEVPDLLTDDVRDFARELKEVCP